VSNAPSQIWLDGSRDHQLCIFKMLVARSRTEDISLSSTSSFTHTFIRQILYQSITFILILLSSISITQFRQYNTNPIFIQHQDAFRIPVFESAPDSSKHQLINSKLRDCGLEQGATLLASLSGDLTSRLPTLASNSQFCTDCLPAHNYLKPIVDKPCHLVKIQIRSLI